MKREREGKRERERVSVCTECVYLRQSNQPTDYDAIPIFLTVFYAAVAVVVVVAVAVVVGFDFAATAIFDSFNLLRHTSLQKNREEKSWSNLK